MSWTMTCSYPLNCASAGSLSLGYSSISSLSILTLSFLLLLECFFGVCLSLSDEWLFEKPFLFLAFMSGFPYSPFRRLFSSRRCWFSASKPFTFEFNSSTRFNNISTVRRTDSSAIPAGAMVCSNSDTDKLLERSFCVMGHILWHCVYLANLFIFFCYPNLLSRYLNRLLNQGELEIRWKRKIKNKGDTIIAN